MAFLRHQRDTVLVSIISQASRVNHIRLITSPHKKKPSLAQVLVALACDDLSVRVVDVSAQRLVRKFSGHTNAITDLCWSSDSRWVLSTSLDRSLRVVDVPTGELVGWYTFLHAPTSLHFSPGGEYLATTHVEQVQKRLSYTRPLISP